MYVLYVCVGGGTCARAADAFIAVVRQSAKCSGLVWVRQSAFAGKIVQLMGRAWVMMIQAHEHVFFGDVHSGNLMVKISYTNDDVSFVPTWIDFGAAVLRREVFLLQRYLREKGIPPHSIGIADGGVQGVDDAPGPFSLACSPLCWKSSLTWESCQRCMLPRSCRTSQWRAATSFMERGIYWTSSLCCLSDKRPTNRSKAITNSICIVKSL